MSYQLAVVVYMKILMYAVTDTLKFKARFLYLWFSGLAISQAV